MMAPLSSTTRRSSHLFQKFRRKPRSNQQPAQTFPEPWECITHLKLMRTFARLQRRLVDPLVQKPLLDSFLHDMPDDQRDHAEAKFRDETWQMYLEIAADRFEAWWKSLAPKSKTDGQILEITRSEICLVDALESRLRDTSPMIWTENNLPPIDVIMILHSYMLNPRAFLEDCIRFNMMSLWKAGMPWHLLDQAIDLSTDEYNVSTSAQKAWKKATGRSWDIQQGRLERYTGCPICGAEITHKTTTMSLCSGEKKQQNVIRKSTVYCRYCNRSFTDEQLKIFKFHQVLKKLNTKDVPLPGTILNKDGLARSITDPTLTTMSGLNNYFSILDVNRNLVTDPEHTSRLPHLTVSDVKAALEDSISPHLGSYPEVDVDTAMKRFFLQITDTHSMFALDLPAAVVRQGDFVHKMEAIDWLHSPSLPHTLSELLRRYAVFFQIMKQNKSNVAVPTHAVDLAWHTHQLSPPSYYAYSVLHADNVFINHDDRIQDDIRTDAFAWTGEQYKLLTGGKDYSQCLCWYCSTATALSGDKAEDLVFGAADDGGHVQLHPDSDLHKSVLTQIAAKQYEKLEEDYGLACQDAVKHCQPVPDRSEFLNSYTWLYPQARPAING